MRFPLKRKTMVLIVLIAVILSGTSLFFSSHIITDIIDTHYRKVATDLAGTVSVAVDSGYADSLRRAISNIYETIPAEERIVDEEDPRFEAYLQNYSHLTESMGYKSLLNSLQLIYDKNSVYCIYLVYLEPETGDCVYMVDTDPEDPCPPGLIDPIDDNNAEALANPEAGFRASITDSEQYGSLVTAGSPVHDINGDVVCFAAVDISMDEVRAQQRRFVLTAALVQTILTIIMCVIGIILVNKLIVQPINLLSDASDRYCNGDSEESMREFEKLEIKTGDEIETLADSMKQMEHDINEHIATLTATMEELRQTREEVDKMDYMANRDALTGVRNKRAYDEEVRKINDDISRSNKRFGVVMIDLNYLKQTNDTYGHEAGNISIQKLCHLTCGIFAHSPVFRIGGDEFTVILRKRDYNNIESLAKLFDESIADLSSDNSLEPAERISAALGYALFDASKDSSFEDVFNRADEEMYARKKAMKSKNK